MVARTLTAVVDAERGREPCSHGLAVRGDPRLLPDHHAVRIHKREPGPSNERIGFLEEPERVCAAVALVVGGEERTDVREPSAPRRASVSAWATTSPSEWPTRPRGWSIVTPPRTSGIPSPNAWASTPRPMRRSSRRPQSRGELGERLDGDGAVRCLLQPSPGPRRRCTATSPLRAPEPRRCRRGRRRTPPRACPSSRQAQRAARKTRDRACVPPGSRRSSPRRRRTSPVPSLPWSRSGFRRSRRTGRPHGAARHTESRPRRGPFAGSRTAPRRRGAARRRGGPRSPSDPRCARSSSRALPRRHSAAPCRGRHLAPDPLLVDERLADVEEDGTDSQAAPAARRRDTSSRSSAVVTLARRGSPSTTAIRPPDRSTSDAQSVAPASSPA